MSRGTTEQDCTEVGGTYEAGEALVPCSLNEHGNGCVVYTGDCVYTPAVEQIAGVLCALVDDLSSCSADSDNSCIYTPSVTALGVPDMEECVGGTIRRDFEWVPGKHETCMQQCGIQILPTPADRFACEELHPGQNQWFDGTPSSCLDCEEALWFDCRDGIVVDTGKSELSCIGEPTGYFWSEKSFLCIEPCSGRVLDAYTDRITCEGTTGYKWIPDTVQNCTTPCGNLVEPAPHDKGECEAFVYAPHTWSDSIPGNCTDELGWDMKFYMSDIVDRKTCERTINPMLSGSYVCEYPVRRVAVNVECPEFSTDLFTTVNYPFLLFQFFLMLLRV
jgi:hypothetical protein